MSATKDDIYAAIATVIDPEVGFNLVAMGLIYDASCNEEKGAKVTMTLSTKACPLHQMIVTWVKEAVTKIDGVDSCEVELVWEPPWNISMADEDVIKALGGM
ncbi:MAG: metal-sulfur cluster assembly factor [Gammaproteobacteria bacterium]|nr:metal-sulfur cluster assembly factor [Gammaproteobacteria bacterium]